MSTFIRKLTETIVAQHGAAIGELCVVFPSRRACAFMQDQISKTIADSMWAPSLFAIEDFVAQMQPATVLDNVSLTFELYPIYHEAFPNESFEQYYNWGQMIVTDFDEVDRHLIDGGKVFQNLAELKKIDITIDAWLNEDQKLSAHQQDYLRFWELLGTFYTQLNARLKIQGMASSGGALRELANRLAKEKPALPWKKVIFAGFNALSPAEELMFLSLMKWGLAECYWDLDAWYVEQEQQEAGKFFRALRQRWERELPELKGNWNWIGDHLQTSAKEMTLIAVPKRVGQAKAAGLLLEALSTDDKPESLALVLPDENLLFPVLHSLPSQLHDINVTMGYPLRNTPLYGLVDAILTLHENAERLRPGGVGEPVYYFRDIANILRHPYILSLASEEGRETMREITRENMIYLSPGYFLRYGQDSLLRFLFEPWTQLGDAIRFLLELFQKLKVAFEAKQKTENPLPTVESEILFHFFTLTQKLNLKLGKYLHEKDLNTFRRIYKEVIIGASVPFSGEPLKGIQVMGMLETRVLDFDRLIILSVNEGILPPKQSQNSLIPYNLRKAFHLPTYEEKDAIYAYHFYRLIQRAKIIQIVYDTQPDGLSGGEKSRFIAQIEAELVARNPNLKINHETFSFPVEAEAIPPIIVDKDAGLIDSLKLVASEKGFSPSALNSYIRCSLQFYFRYLLGLKEKELIEESMEENTFGLVLHGVLEQLYEPWNGKTITQEDIVGLLPSVDSTVERVFKAKTNRTSIQFGRNRLLLGVIRDLVRQMLEIDQAAAPFELLGLEKEMEVIVPTPRHPEGVKMRGFIDRVDKVNGRIRIIDYKTGNIDRLDVKNFLDLLEGKPLKEAFQLGSYAYLYSRLEQPDRVVYPGIFSMRNLQKGFLTLEYGPQKLPEFDLTSLAEFEGLLVNLFDDILDPEKPFSQTEDEARCIFCPYKVICNRT